MRSGELIIISPSGEISYPPSSTVRHSNSSEASRRQSNSRGRQVSRLVVDGCWSVWEHTMLEMDPDGEVESITTRLKQRVYDDLRVECKV